MTHLGLVYQIKCSRMRMSLPQLLQTSKLKIIVHGCETQAILPITTRLSFNCALSVLYTFLDSQCGLKIQCVWDESPTTLDFLIIVILSVS